MNNITTAEQAVRDAILMDDGTAILAAGRVLDSLEQPRGAVGLLGAALWYAEQGLKVFPLQAGAKIPHKLTRGFKDATTDEPTIRHWWATRPDSNIGVATGHLVDVIDIDGHAGQCSRTAHWDDIFERVQADRLATVLTPRPGGMHLYVPATGDGNKAGILPGIDYRGLGGYVVAPPSVIVDGANPGTYAFLGEPHYGAAKAA